MSDAERGTAEQGSQKLDMSVKVYPAPRTGQQEPVSDRHRHAGRMLRYPGPAYPGQ